ncbi:MAG: ABC transporter permease [Lachnospiraceae bacterium]|nr:ABC transporter permease [Lachnospiraceae bacterium]
MCDMNEKKDIISGYMVTNVRRMVKLCPAIIIGLSILCFSVLIGAKVFLGNSIEESRKKLVIGAVGDVKNDFFESGLTALCNLDATRFIIEIVSLDIEEAESLIREGKLTSYMVIPEGFVNSVMYGDNDKVITYVCGEGDKGLTSIIMEEIVETFSNYITYSQSAIYASSKLKKDNGMGSLSDKELLDINTRYINLVLGREKTCELELIGVGNELSTVGYYFCGLLVVVFMLFGISCNLYYNRRSKQIQRLLYSKGHGFLRQIIDEYVPVLLINLVAALIIWFVLSVLVNEGSINIFQLEMNPIRSFWLFLPKMIPVIILISIMQLLIYEITQNMVSSILLQFIVSISMAYVSGCFYPKQFFPEVLQFVGDMMPAGVCINYMSSCITGNSMFGSLIYMIVLSAIMFFGTILLRQIKIRGDIA